MKNSTLIKVETFLNKIKKDVTVKNIVDVVNKLILDK